MYYKNDKAFDVKIAYIGGGSRGWARGLMSDLAMDGRLNGTVCLYDIDGEAAEENAVIGNKIQKLPECKAEWKYVVEDDITVALTGADFVVISILPGTFDEMESDVHAPEEYGIYQSVGDSVGAGGIIRAVRTVPMYKFFAENIKACCPDAWVINYTNPMTVCTRTLYAVFPEIKAFGCCHEVFGTQEFIANVYREKMGETISRNDVNVNLFGVNHFTWVNEIKYRNNDLMPLMFEYAEKHPDGAAFETLNWMNKNFAANQAVKLDLLKRYRILAAAGDRHLAEFCPGEWYLKDPETVDKWKFRLTTVAWRKQDQKEKIENTKAIANGEKEPKIELTGEEGVNQMAALLGLGSYVTNVNLPNEGQIENLPYGAVVETNAYFSGDSIKPVHAGKIPNDVCHLISRHVYNQESLVKGILAGDYEEVFRVFVNEPNVVLPVDKARELFDKMLYNTKKYLPVEDYERYLRSRQK